MTDLQGIAVPTIPRALLLGAGHGTRLRPLTAFLPKALAPVGLRPLLDWHIEALSRLEVELVALNASHLANRLEEHLKDRTGVSPQVALIREEAPHGTGGGLLRARDLLIEEDCFMVINADTFHTVDLRSALATHRNAGADATLVVRRSGPGEPQDELAFARNGRLTAVANRAARSGWRFAGIHVLSSRIFKHLSSPGSLAQGYVGLVREGAVVVGHNCGASLWFDIGAPADYLNANRAAAQISEATGKHAHWYQSVEPSLVAASAKIGPNCTIGPSAVIGDGAVVGADCKLSDSVVWPGTTVPARTTLDRCVVHPGGTLSIDASATQ